MKLVDFSIMWNNLSRISKPVHHEVKTYSLTHTELSPSNFLHYFSCCTLINS